MALYSKHVTFIVFLVFSFCANQLAAQDIHIPDYVYFAGMKLNFSDKLKEELKTEVAGLTKNKQYQQAKIDRADAYFPIVERIFQEEGVSTDFKYLAIQESGLMPDVVSKSNAVGYWQFKQESGTEVGLRIDHHVDERMHIASSSRAAARYMKKNYLLLTNWFYALIAYNTGFGGVKPLVDSKYIGASEMDLDDNTHWYAVKFLAHKLAFEDKVGYNKTPPVMLLEYTDVKNKTLYEIASEAGMQQEKLSDYNKWLLKHKIPDDKEYSVLIPVSYLERDQVAARLKITGLPVPVPEPEDPPIPHQAQLVIKPGKPLPSEVPLLATYNSLDAIIARQGDNAAKLALAGDISLSKFLKYNEMENYQEVKPGSIYYLESKNKKALVLYHTVLPGESLWDIAQKYGITVSSLMRKNRMEEGEALVEGRLMYLKYNRPSDEPIEIAQKPVVKTPPVVVDPSSVKNVSFDTLKRVVISPEKPANRNVASVIPKNPVEPVIMPEPTLNSSLLNNHTTTPNQEIVGDSAFQFHMVFQGQTLFSLSRHYGIKSDSLAAWNGLSGGGLKVLQKVIVKKSGGGLTNRYAVYSVNKPAFISAVASELNVPSKWLVEWNAKKDTLLIPGEQLKFRR